MNITTFHENKMTVSQVLEQNPAAIRDTSIPNYQLNKEQEATQEQTPVNDPLVKSAPPLIGLNEGQTSAKSENDKKQVKRVKKRKSQNSKRCKSEKNGDGEEAAEKEHGDDEHNVSLHSQPVSRGESLLNSSILDEILSEKKRVLLESAEMTEFLRSRIKP